MLDQANIKLAQKLMDEDSMSSPHNALSHDDKLQDTISGQNFFLNKLENSGSTSREELHHALSAENPVLFQLNTQPEPNTGMPVTTPLSTDSGAQKIKIEISGQPEELDISHRNGYLSPMQHQNL